MIHNLKTWPEYFRAVRNREKTFELRFNDRDFKVGDVLLLQEFNPCHACKAKGKMCDAMNIRTGNHTPVYDCPDCKGSGGKHTGLTSSHRVTYILSAHQGLREGFVIMGLARAYLPAQEPI